MEDMSLLYARYDGPLPRQPEPATGRLCREALLRALLREIRLARKSGTTNLRALTEHAKEMRGKISGE